VGILCSRCRPCREVYEVKLRRRLPPSPCGLRRTEKAKEKAEAEAEAEAEAKEKAEAEAKEKAKD